jgi:hypothetical protein
MAGKEQNFARNESLTVGTSEVMLSGKRARKTIYLRNTSTGGQVITIVFDDFNAAVLGKGIILAPGEFITESTTEGYECWSGDIKGIGTAAGGTIALMEQPKEDSQ